MRRRKFRRRRRNLKTILLWSFIILIGYLIISFLFFPIHFQKIKNTFSQAEGRFVNEEAIDMNHNCDFRSVEFFGYEKEDIIKLDCTNACNKKGLTYVSYGCPKNKFTCYCK